MEAHAKDDFKTKVKDTFIEMLENDREAFYPLFQEIMEDFALSRAMEEGEASPEVDEQTVLDLLTQ